MRWLIPTLDRFPRRQKFLLGDRIQTMVFPGPLTSWERGLPAREPPEPPAFLRPRALPGSQPCGRRRTSIPSPGVEPASPHSQEARGPDLSFVCNQDKIWGRMLLTAGSGASCEEGTFLAGCGQVSENEVRSFHIGTHPRGSDPRPR